MSKSHYLSRAAISNLKKHKYSSIDKSPLSKHVLSHYWDFCLRFVPRSLAPNLITLIGFFIILLNFILLLIFDPLLKGPAQSWLLYSYGLGIFFYQTLDNLDGKQARRINQSTPLGELFDHGLDAITCGLTIIMQCSAVGLASSRLCLSLFGMTILAFYFTTWEEYYTKVLFLGYINGPTEGILTSVMTCFISAFYGLEIWNKRMSFFLPYLVEKTSIFDTKLKYFAGYAVLLISMVFQLAFSLYATFNACKKRNIKYRSALFNLVSIMTMVVGICSWTLSKNSAIFESNPVLCMAYWSVLFGYLATKVIVARITDMPFPQSTKLIVPIVVGSIFMNTSHLYLTKTNAHRAELYYVSANFAILLKIYLNYAFGVVDEICAGLHINCLRLNK